MHGECTVTEHDLCHAFAVLTGQGREQVLLPLPVSCYVEEPTVARPRRRDVEPGEGDGPFQLPDAFRVVHPAANVPVTAPGDISEAAVVECAEAVDDELDVARRILGGQVELDGVVGEHRTVAFPHERAQGFLVPRTTFLCARWERRAIGEVEGGGVIGNPEGPLAVTVLLAREPQEAGDRAGLPPLVRPDASVHDRRSRAQGHGEQGRRRGLFSHARDSFETVQFGDFLVAEGPVEDQQLVETETGLQAERGAETDGQPHRRGRRPWAAAAHASVDRQKHVADVPAYDDMRPRRGGVLPGRGRDRVCHEADVRGFPAPVGKQEAQVPTP